jgi:hypothetical protein
VVRRPLDLVEKRDGEIVAADISGTTTLSEVADAIRSNSPGLVTPTWGVCHFTPHSCAR